MNAFAPVAYPPSMDPSSIPSLPHNLEAEQALLGSLMFDNAVFERLSDRLRGAHFYEPFHQRLYEAIEDHIRQGLLARFNAIPAARRNITVTQALREWMAEEHPCAR